MSLVVQLCLLTFFALRLLNAEALPNTYFLNPPAAGDEGFFALDDVFQIGVPINITWKTNMQNYSIWIWGQYLDINNAYGDSKPLYAKSEGDPEEGGFEWNVTTGSFSLSDTNVYFLSLGQSQFPIDDSATCHYFNLTNSVVASELPLTTSATTASSSTITKSTSSAISATTTVATGTETPTSTPTPSPAKSSSALGIGLGLGLGIPLALLAAAFSSLKFYQYRQRNLSIWPGSSKNSTPGLGGSYSGVGQNMDLGSPAIEFKSELPADYQVAELPAVSNMTELPAVSNTAELPAGNHGN